MWQDILTAFSLYLIIEGMIPFINPAFFRRAVSRIAELGDNNLSHLLCPHPVGEKTLNDFFLKVFSVRRK